MTKGWVKLYRKALDSGLIKNHKLWAFWTWCLMKASHDETVQMVGSTKVKLLPGQFVFGRSMAAKELGMSDKSIRICLKTLKDLESVASKSTNKFSVITVVNWRSYQTSESENNQKEGQQRASKTAIKRASKGCAVNNVKSGRCDEASSCEGQQKGQQKGHKQEVKEKRIYRQIFDHWNNKGIIRHKKIDQSLPHLKARLKDFSEEEILEAIDNYAVVVHGGEYYFTHKWPLSSFLKQSNAFECFLTVNDPFSNYRTKGAEKEAAPVEPQADCSICRYKNTDLCTHCEESGSKVNFQHKENTSC